MTKTKQTDKPTIGEKGISSIFKTQSRFVQFLDICLLNIFWPVHFSTYGSNGCIFTCETFPEQETCCTYYVQSRPYLPTYADMLSKVPTARM